MNKISIRYISNADGGIDEKIDIEKGTTVEQLFEQKNPGREMDDYAVTVNRRPCDGDDVLMEDDRVSILPKKVVGAV